MHAGYAASRHARADLIRGLATHPALHINLHLLVIETRGSPTRDALHPLNVAVRGGGAPFR